MPVSTPRLIVPAERPSGTVWSRLGCHAREMKPPGVGADDAAVSKATRTVVSPRDECILDCILSPMP